MRGVFVDANGSLADIFERLNRPSDPPVRVNHDADITADQMPAVLDGTEVDLGTDGVAQGVLVLGSPDFLVPRQVEVAPRSGSFWTAIVVPGPPGALAEVAGPGALLVADGAMAELLGAVERLCDDPELHDRLAAKRVGRRKNVGREEGWNTRQRRLRGGELWETEDRRCPA